MDVRLKGISPRLPDFVAGFPGNLSPFIQELMATLGVTLNVAVQYEHSLIGYFDL